MRFENVALEGLAHVLPEERVRSLDLEERLAPLYRRLRLREGRLELMTGIRERRFWPPGTRPSAVAAEAGRRLLERTGFDRSRIGLLVHGSVSRDFLEPATASFVHRALELPRACTAFDLSNACLGAANGMLVGAGMIERGDVQAALVVAGESGRPLVEATLAHLGRAGADLDGAGGPGKEELKRSLASLTIGSGAAAVLLARADRSHPGPAFLGGVVRAATEHSDLCHGDVPEGLAGPLMETDSEALLVAGNALAAETWRAFEAEIGWSRGDVDRVVTHQVTTAHRRAVLATLGLDPGLDFPTVEELGNIGSVSLPLTLSMAAEAGFVREGHRVALLGIGSGLHCAMLAVRW